MFLLGLSGGLDRMLIFCGEESSSRPVRTTSVSFQYRTVLWRSSSKTWSNVTGVASREGPADLPTLPLKSELGGKEADMHRCEGGMV